MTDPPEAPPEPAPPLLAPAASEPAVRADGGAIAFTVTRADLDTDRWVREVVVVDPAGVTLGRSGGEADHLPRFAPTGDALVHLRTRPDGGDTIVRWPGGAAVAAFAAPVRTFAWSPDGTRLAVVVQGTPPGSGPLVRRGPAYKRDGEGWHASEASVAVVDVATGAVHLLLGPSLGLGGAAWTADGTAVLVTRSADPARWRTDLLRVPLDGGDPEALTAHGDWDQAACPLPVPGGIAYIGGEAGPGHAVTLVLDAGGGLPRRLAPELDRNVTVGAPAYPGAPPVVHGADLLFTANDGSVSRLFAAPLDGGPARALTAADAVVGGLATAGGRAVVTTASWRRTGAVAVVGGPTLWSGPELDPPWAVERLAVTAPDGRAVPCWLLRSRAAAPGPAPTLVDLHGGPHNVANPALGPGNLHRWLLASEGWHVVLPNARGSDGYGEQWYRGLEPGGGWAGADLADVRAVADAVVAEGVADPDRLALHGYSYGGLLVAALTSTSSTFRAAALGGAPVDLRAFVSSSDLPPALWEREVGGLPWAARAYDERSPIHRVGDVRAPTLVVHGTADQRVPVSQGEQWFQGLQAAGVPSELVLYPGASHGFVTSGPPATVADVAARIARWLARWCPPAA